MLERVNRLLVLPQFRTRLAQLADLEQDRVYCRHDLGHLLDVARVATLLLMEEGRLAAATGGGGRELVYAAALLHDLGRSESGNDHAVAGGALAGQLLPACGFGPEETELVRRAVGEHRAGLLQRSLLGEALYRADRLSRPCVVCGVLDSCHRFPTGSRPGLGY